MTAPNKNGAGSATDPTTATKTTPPESRSPVLILEHPAPDGARLNELPPTPTVRAVAYAPHRGRIRYLLIVESCPHCEAAHALRPARLGLAMTRRCPVLGRKYVALVSVRRSVRRVRRAA